MKNNIVKWVALGTFGLGFMLHNGVVQGMNKAKIDSLDLKELHQNLANVTSSNYNDFKNRLDSFKGKPGYNKVVAQLENFHKREFKITGVGGGNPPAQGFASLFDNKLSADERLKIITGADASKLAELRQVMTGKGVTLQDLNGGALKYKGGSGSLLVDGVYKLADASNTYLEFRLVGGRLTTKNTSGNYSVPLKSPVLLELLKK